MFHKMSWLSAVWLVGSSTMATVPIAALAATPPVAVAPQYDTSHVYVAPAEVERFVASFLATFGGTTTKQVVVNVSPVASSTS